MKHAQLINIVANGKSIIFKSIGEFRKKYDRNGQRGVINAVLDNFSNVEVIYVGEVRVWRKDNAWYSN